MSYILEALKKAQAERQLGATPTIHAPTLDSGVIRNPSAARWKPLALAAGAAVAAGALMLLWRQPGTAPIASDANRAALSQPAEQASPGAPGAAPVVAIPAGVAPAGSVPAGAAPAGAVAAASAAALPALAAPAAALPAATVSAVALPAATVSNAAEPAAVSARAPVAAVPATAPVAAVARSAPAAQHVATAAKTSALPAPAVASAPRLAPVDAAQPAPSLPPAPSLRLAPSLPPTPGPAQATATAAVQPAAKPPAKSAPAPVEPQEEAVQWLRELPEPIQRSVPAIAMGGYMYSKNPADRLVLIDKVLRREGEEVAPGLVLEKLQPKAAVFTFKGYRYRMPY